MPDFTCGTCGHTFSIPDATLAKFPGWTPKQCMKCKGAKGASKPSAPRSSRSGEPNRTTREVLAAFKDGPDTGVFTDGAASPNPGPGGFGAVYVESGKIVSEQFGHEPHTTNNRMELKALIAGFKLVPAGTKTTVYTDSELCVNTITQWAAAWKRNGWKKKTGEIKNLELVKELYELAQNRPEITLKWIKAHAGSRWNEYADALATAYRRAER
jgi:ribonuclease HI